MVSKLKKKANIVLSVLFIIVFLFGFAILTFYIFKASDAMNDVIQDDPELTNQSKEMFDDFNTAYPSIFDAAFVIAVIILWLFALFFSFMVDTNPILFGLIIFLLIFVFYIGASLSNQFDEDMSTSDNAVQAANFPMTNWIFDNFLIVIGVIAFTVMIALFAKFGSTG